MNHDLGGKYLLYLLEPSGPLKWDDIPTSVAIEAEKTHGVDLGRLPWLDAERTVTADTIRVALRHGIRCSRGIVIEPIHLIDLERADQLKNTFAEMQQAQVALQAQDLWMEKLMPGWIESGQKLNASIEDSTFTSIREAESKAAALLAAPVVKSLLDHWTELGGYDPDA